MRKKISPKLQKRLEVVKEKLNNEKKNNEPRLGCQSNCVGCVGVN